MNTDKKTYAKYAKNRSPKSPTLKNSTFAFLVGGTLCALAELLFHLYLYLGISEEITKTLVPVTFIVLAGFMTGVGVFDDIARFAGAGTLVPITGFANAVVASAIDDKSEGFILGIGAKMFTVAGPVIVFGTMSSAIYGVIYFLFGAAK